MKFKIAFFSLILISLASCKQNQEVATETVSAETTLTESSLTIENVTIEGDTLFASVSYSGGCGEHEFSLEANGAMMKSLPPKQPLRIIHRSNNDPCRAHIVEELKFDISKYRGTPSGITVILLENWNQHLNYSY